MARKITVTGTLAAVNQAIPIKVKTGHKIIAKMETSTVAGVNCIFEGSQDSTNGVDGTWTGARAQATNTLAQGTTVAATGSLGAAPAYAWDILGDGFQWVRLRCTAITSGAALFTVTRSK